MIKRYGRYKDSGVEWIGEIPEHWDVKKLKYLAMITPSNIDKKSKEDEQKVYLCNYLDVYKNALIDKRIEFMQATASNAQIEKFQLQLGDVIATKDSEDPSDIGIPSYVSESLADTVCGYHLTLMRPIKSHLAGIYLFQIFCTNQYRNFFETEANGITRYALNTDSFANLPILLPTLTEQTVIAAFLDRKTNEIDQLISNKEKLIAIYEEEKTAIINQAITRGLDPNVKLEPSGVEWLSDVPEHWEIKRLKYAVSKVGSGITPKGGASIYELTGIPLLRSQNIHFDGLRLDDVAFITKKIHNEMKNSKVMDGDVLLNITGASIGRCFYVDNKLGEANVNQHVCIIRPKNTFETKFTNFLLRSNIGQEQINIEQTGSGREGLNFETLKNFLIPFLNLTEQSAIVTHIETQCTRIDTIIEKLKKQIELFKEYRNTLISEVVTGKIDVSEMEA